MGLFLIRRTYASVQHGVYEFYMYTGKVITLFVKLETLAPQIGLFLLEPAELNQDTNLESIRGFDHNLLMCI